VVPPRRALPDRQSRCCRCGRLPARDVLVADGDRSRRRQRARLVRLAQYAVLVVIVVVFAHRARDGKHAGGRGPAVRARAGASV